MSYILSLLCSGLQDYVDRMFLFCHGMAHLGVDNAEYALLTAICILSGMFYFLNHKLCMYLKLSMMCMMCH